MAETAEAFEAGVPLAADEPCRITCDALAQIGIAQLRAGLAPIRSLTLTNIADADLPAPMLSLTADPPILRAEPLRLAGIAAGASRTCAPPPFSLEEAGLDGLKDGMTCTLTLAATAGDHVLGRATIALSLLPATHWAGTETAPEALATFVRPCDPAVGALLARAAEHLVRARGAGLATYAEGRARVWDTAQAIHAALRDQALADRPSPDFSRRAERLRGPGAVLGDGHASPLDRALILAACFERAGLNPLLVLGEATVAAGLWLVDARFSEALGDDAQGLRKRRDLDDLILIAPGPAAFPEALAAGAAMVEAGTGPDLDLVLDLRGARLRGLAPLAQAEGAAATLRPMGTDPFAPAPAFAEDRPPPVPERRLEARPRDRLEAWKLRLLDLTLRNRLLNFRPGKASLTLSVPEPDALAGLLAAGTAIRLLPKPDGPAPADGSAQDDLLRAAARGGEVLTGSAADDLDARLTDLFRLARTGLEEGGANVLHLAFGFLSWTRGGAMAPVRAPLLLVPVALTRTSVRAGFRLVRHDAEARVNPTLIEMLRQDFGLTLPDLDAGDGLDVAGLWRSVRGHVRDLKGFEVETDVVLSTFAFTKVLMWRDLAERTDLLKRNPVVRHLLDSPTLAYGDATGFPAPERLDAEHPPQGVFTPLPADSSQLSAILAAGAGRDFVLVGPPGTGKSQTIANIIAHTLALGRTVLFVSQKTAALDVVRRRLDAAGLGACCLEVHGARAQKAHVLAQLREAWAAREPETVPWHEAGADLERRRAALNDVVTRLHAPRANGLDVHAALGRVIADRGSGVPRIALSWPDHAAHTPATLAGLRARAAELAALLPVVGDPGAHPLRGVGPAEWSPLWRAGMERALANLAAALPPFGQAADRLGAALGLRSSAETWTGTRALVALANGLARPEAAVGLRCLAADAGLLRQAVEARRAHEAALAQAAARLRGRYAEAVFETDLAATRDAWRAARGANLLVRGAKLRRLRRMLEPDALSPLPDDIGPDLATLVEVKRLRAAGPALAGTLEAAFAAFGPPWCLPSTPADAFAAPLAWAGRMAPVLAALATEGEGAEVLRLRCVRLLAPDAPHASAAIGEARAALAPLRPAALRAIETLGRLAARPHPDRPLAAGPGWLAETLARAARWADALPKAQVWLRWQGAVRAAHEAGLGPLVAAIEAGTLPAEAIPEAFERAYAGWWIDHVVTHDPVLRGFRGPDHEAAIADFRVADARLCALAGAAARARLGRVPSPVAFGADAEWGLLAREIAKRGRHLALRQLFARLPGALTRLTPCVMMSPLSVAQHWPAEGPPFDLVIFDEASQIAPWDAIGAIARGRQVVIVGDPEQLPPTSVGERDDRETDEGAGDLDVPDQESILDECLAAHLPQRRLTWHYRSRHESLIAFSNRHYYRGGLITFPSPVTADRAVRLVTVSDGLYERGAARVNRPEARAVVAEVLARLRGAGPAPCSLGIVTFNGEQQRLIENLLDAERRADPELERHFDARLTPEPVFVKNLETVQGDERDAILFSVAVGPDGAGRITGQISSLNRAGGHRRLNVAITRARRELRVFASLRPEQIDLGRGAARGIRDFKHFLDFAAHGAPALERAAAPTGRDVESPFEAGVMAALEARGWRVVPQVGVSSFRIDLGIVHPDAPGRYLAGVECDGATYHGAATARDRDRLRAWVLTDLGWRLHRVWSTDWWIDADGALDRLDAALRADLAADGAVPEPGPEPASPMPEPPTPYAVTDLSGFSPDAARLHEPGYDTTLDAIVARVIAGEGPLFADLLVTRVVRAHGLSRTTARLRARILARVGEAVPRGHEAERVVLWPIGADPRRPVPFRPASGEPRDPADIPLAELAGLASSLGGDPGDRPERMARHLGVPRPREGLRRRFACAVALARPASADPVE